MEKCKFRIKLQAEACNFTKSITPPWVFFVFFHCANGTKSCKASHMGKVKRTSKSDVVANCTGSKCPSCRSIATLFIINDFIKQLCKSNCFDNCSSSLGILFSVGGTAVYIMSS